ncbi:TPA: hypothetical protein ACGOW0_000899 [Streptococcus suis]
MQLFTYNDFTSEKGHLAFEECQTIHNEILASSDKNNSEFLDYWKEFLSSCVSYAEARGKWFLLSKEERMDFDSKRTTIHNKVIFNLKIIKALANEKGKDTTWFDKFQDERKRIGDFACYLAYVYGVNAR